MMKHRRLNYLFLLAIPLAAFLCFPKVAKSQGWFRTGINMGQATIRIAVPDFAARSSDPKLVGLTNDFNQVLWNDLNNSGIVVVISKSLYPVKTPQEPQDVDFNGWSNPPASAQMLAFGYTEERNNSLVVTARLFDVQSPKNPNVLAKRYVADLNELSARDAAHRFANEIIQALGGGIPGINLTKIAYVSKRTGHTEIWVMDYDGFNQHQITNYPNLNLTPRWSPDNSEIAFTSYATGRPQIYLYSLLTNRRISFPTYKGLNTTPAWSPDGKKIAFCSSMSGAPEIYVSDSNGMHLQRITFGPGVNISPVWNPKTGNEIAFVSDRSGAPQIYIINSDGTNLRRLITAGGDAEAPAWSPNGLFMAFSWSVRETGHWDVYVIEIATGRIVQLTQNAGRNEHPTWAPDGRHIVFESTRTGTRQIWTMLADGSNPHQLTTKGSNWNPNWSR
ncbi:MAG TPA: Tol-Pal system beta propeller repeat protein TolB [Terriglobia bacterium]|nr:Tol-Pal system beta propeller repeat protein TolB [Terriglobia bacterium]